MILTGTALVWAGYLVIRLEVCSVPEQQGQDQEQVEHKNIPSPVIHNYCTRNKCCIPRAIGRVY